MGQVTALLSAIAQGEREALGKLYALLYPELRYFAGMTASETADVLGLACAPSPAAGKRLGLFCMSACAESRSVPGPCR